MIRFIVVVVLILAMNGTATASPQSLKYAPHLSRVSSALTGRTGTRVFCNYRATGTAGEAWKGSNALALAPDVCTALRQAPRLVEPEYPRLNTGQAIFTFAHESGHLVRSIDENAESQADCYATAHFTRAALLLGFRRSDLPELRRQARPACWH